MDKECSKRFSVCIYIYMDGFACACHSCYEFHCVLYNCYPDASQCSQDLIAYTDGSVTKDEKNDPPPPHPENPPVKVGYHCYARCVCHPWRCFCLYGLRLQHDNGSSHTCSKLDSPVRCHNSHRVNELTTKKGNDKPRLAWNDVWHPLLKTPIDVLSWTCQSQGEWLSRVACGFKCWGSWDSVCWLITMGITLSIIWRREP